MCQVNSQFITSVCPSWNKGVRSILNLPHDAHNSSLGLLLKQAHTKNQFIVRMFCFPFCRLKSPNGIVAVYTMNAIHNALPSFSKTYSSY